MQRGQFAHPSVATGARAALTAVHIAFVCPGRLAGELTPAANAIFCGVVQRLLADALPADPMAHADAPQGHFDCVAHTVAGVPLKPCGAP